MKKPKHWDIPTSIPLSSTLSRDPRWGRTVESYGEDSYLAGELGTPASIGYPKQPGCFNTETLFAIYGIPGGGRDCYSRTDPHASPQEVHELHLEPFRIAFQEEAGALGTMCSHNDYNGTPVSASHYLMTELLRNQWGFKGYVVSDSWAIDKNVKFYHIVDTEEEAVASELNAGLNVRTFFEQSEVFIEALRRALQKGLVEESTPGSARP